MKPIMMLAMMPVLLLATSVHPHLAEQLSLLGDNDPIRVIVMLKEQADCWGFPEQAYKEKIEYIKGIAELTQAPLVSWLRDRTSLADLQQFSVVNAFACTLPKSLVMQLAGRDDVMFMVDDFKENMLPPNENPVILDYFAGGEDYVAWNQAIISADEVWNLGYAGAGVVAGNMDTGVDWSHPRLRGSYRGISGWYNCCAYGSTTAPFDDNGHGTGTMGLLAANYGIGTAPKIRWIAVKILDSLGSGSQTDVLEGFNWVFNLPDSLRPKVMSNSWGWSTGLDTMFWTCCLNWKNAGILPVFAAGNDGPDMSTLGRPARLPTVLSVGATDPNDYILSYSSRGPAPTTAPINNPTYWYRSDWNYHKPEIAAPADPTTTTAPDNHFQSFNGTSASSPHAAGVAALLLNKNLSLTNAQLYNTILDYAELVYPLTHNFPNDTFGWGRADAFKALQNTPDPTVPNIFITAAKCTLDTDSDGELDPGETNVRLKVTFKNTGAATSNEASIYLSTNNSYITFDDNDVRNITIGAGQEYSTYEFQIDASALLPENSFVYFCARILDGTNTRYDFFNIPVPAQGTAGGVDTLTYCDALYYYWKQPDQYGDSLFNERFKATAPCTLTQARLRFYKKSGNAPIRVYLWQSTGTAPGAKLDSVDVTYANIQINPNYTTVTFANRHFFDIGAEFHIGYMLRFDSSDDSCHILSDEGTTGGIRSYEWYNGAWSSMSADWGVDVDFDIQAVVKTLPSNQPLITYGGTYKIDDSQFGNNDGYLDPGERVMLSLSLANDGVVCHNVTGKLRGADATTLERIAILDSTATFGTIQKGTEGGSNALDPFVVQMFDESPLEGWNPSFKLVLAGNYGTGNGTVYTDSFTFSVGGPWMPWSEDTLWYPLGTNDLWIGYNTDNTWYWATHSLFGTDSIYLDSMDVYVYSHNGTGNITLPLKIWNVGANGYPGSVIWSGNAPTTVRGWASVQVAQKIPGEFYVGYQNVSPGANWNDIIIWGSPFIGDITFVDDDGTWTPAPDQGYIGAPLAFYLRINDRVPAISYYAPAGWTWPIVPSNSEPGDTVLDASLVAADSTYITDFVCLNRSDITAGPVTGGFDNYLFLDNWGLAYTAPESLAGWNYTYGYTNKVFVPGGRHTLLSWLDWNDEVYADIFNYYLRTWGQQYVWKPSGLLLWTPELADYAPDFTGLGAGPHYNASAWHASTWSNRWQGVGIRPRRMASCGDSIDLDLRLYSDSTTGPNTGFTQVLEASCMGPGKVDFVVWNGRLVGTTYYPGVYSFGSANDSFSVNFYPSYYFIDTLYTQTHTATMTANTPIHVYDLIVYASGSGFNTYSPNLTPAAGLDLGVGVYKPINGDPILRRSDAAVWADANGAGGVENFTYTNSTAAPETLALVVWANSGSGTYTLNGKGVSIGIEEEETNGQILPRTFALDAIQPNPVRDRFLLSYAMPRPGRVSITLYDAAGRSVRKLVNAPLAAGFYAQQIDTRQLASGIYFCRMETDEFKAVQKLVIVK